ncbi:GNAT family N-acetyltransferase [Kitasatospora sp. NPDC001539]|uniref:GNAT family N-acetyltransferase n=1 Tax=Kitasatospora sp. NPDC001539 TaxID=3154384 RepID=UPI00333102A9
MNSLPAWTLVPAGPEDLEAVVELKALVMRADLERLGRWCPERSRERVRKSFSTRHTSLLLVEGAFAGCVTVRPDDRGGRHLELFYLAPHLQGRGLGGAVLRHLLAEADAAREPVHLVVLRGSAARRLYERHGFAVVHEDPVDVTMLREPAPTAAPPPSPRAVSSRSAPSPGRSTRSARPPRSGTPAPCGA